MIASRAAALAAIVMLGPAGISFAAAQAGSNSAAPQGPGAAQQQAQVDDMTVHKVGTALRHVAAIRQQYLKQAQATKSPQQQADLTTQAKQDMVKAISSQGLSVDQYEQVIQLAQNNPNLRQRLIAVAQAGD